MHSGSGHCIQSMETILTGIFYFSTFKSDFFGLKKRVTATATLSYFYPNIYRSSSESSLKSIKKEPLINKGQGYYISAKSLFLAALPVVRAKKRHSVHGMSFLHINLDKKLHVKRS